VKPAPCVLIVKSAAAFAILELFLPIVNALVLKSYPWSITDTSSPALGDAGKVKVNAPPFVFAKICAPG
jgi:hypothetical protein